MIDWDPIRKEYEETGINMTDLANKYGIKPATLRKRKSRDSWEKVTQDVTKKVTRDLQPETEEVLSESDLSDIEERFCLEYMVDFNKTQAYMRARPGTAYNSAATSAQRLFQKDKVQERLTELRDAKANELFFTAMDLDAQLLKLAMADMRQFAEWGTEEVTTEEYTAEGLKIEHKKIKPFLRYKNSEQVDGQLVQEVSLGRDGLRVKFPDKLRAIAELLKRFEFGDDDPGESYENDGFLDALTATGAELWTEEEDYT